jgi:hypothetical protein
MKRYKRKFEEKNYNFLYGKYDNRFYDITENTKDILNNIIIIDYEGYKETVYDILHDDLLYFPKLRISNEIKKYIKKISLIDNYYSPISSEVKGRFEIITTVGKLLIEIGYSKYSDFSKYIYNLNIR